MSPRALYVVAALAAVAVVLAVVGQRRSAPSAAPETAPALPGLGDALDELVRVTVVAAGRETVATLERGETTWTVAERAAYPADMGKLRAALIALSEARVVELKTADPALHDAIGVEDVELEAAAGTLVRLTAEDGATRELILGSSDRAGERYARRPGEAQSFLMDRDPEIPREPAAWLAPPIVDVDGARVRSVSIRYADGAALDISKAEPAERNFTVAAIPDGRELRNAGVANVTGTALRGLALEDAARFEAEATGDPAATIVYSTFDGLEVTLESYTLDDAEWLTFSASARASAADEVRAEADAINERVAGWRYRIAAYRHDQITRRIDDLLAPAE